MKEKRLEQFLLFMSLVTIIIIMYGIFNGEYKKVDIDDYLDNELLCDFC